jgi:hypothetical protein
VKAHDRGKISDYVIADRLAQLNYEAHRNVRDDTVGPRCIVVWRRRPGGQSRSGGGHQFYTGIDRDQESAAFPVISNGLDAQAISGVYMKMMMANLTSPDFKMGDELFVDEEEINQKLAELPYAPDEKLR